MKNYQNKAVENNEKKQDYTAARVTQYMTKELITFSPETEIMEAINSLLHHRISGAPVLNTKKELVGLIDDKDCLKVVFDSIYHNQPVTHSTVASYMSNVMKTISYKASIVEVADVFLKTKFKRLLVIDDDGKLVGQISRRDILWAIKEFNRNAH